MEGSHNKLIGGWEQNQGSPFSRKSKEQLLVGEVFTICHFSPSTFSNVETE